MPKKLIISCSLLSGNIYIGSLNSAGDGFLGDQTDVTTQAMVAVAQHIAHRAAAGTTLSKILRSKEKKAPSYRIAVTRLGDGDDEEEVAAIPVRLLKELRTAVYQKANIFNHYAAIHAEKNTPAGRSKSKANELHAMELAYWIERIDNWLGEG